MNAKMTILFCILSDKYYKLLTTPYPDSYRGKSLSAIITHYPLFLIYIFIDNNNK